MSDMSDPVPAEQIAGYLGLKITRTEADTVRVTLPAEDRLSDAEGVIHPVGLLVAIDMAAGMSTGFATLPRWTLTADMSISLHRLQVSGRLHAVGRAVRIGGRTALAEIVVVDDDGGDIATASVNHAVVPMDSPLQFVDLPVGESTTPPKPSWVSTPATQLFETGRTSDGAMTIGLNEATRNPWGLLHGAVLGHLAMAAAMDAGDLEPRHLTIRYLSPISAGAAQARVTRTVTDALTGEVRTVQVRSAADSALRCLAYIHGQRR